MGLSELTIEQAEKGIAEKKFSPTDLAGAFRERIAKYDEQLKVFLDVEKGSVSGIPMAVKDNMLIAGQATTAGSKILESYVAPYTATAVKKLQEAGFSVLGKTNLDEFAMGSSTENSGFFPTKNPWDRNRVPGGSSGGSAAAVAADLCVFALGSDTGGSIRQPASFCGVVGLKPTYGRISRYGLIATASSLDQIGPITKTVKDAAIVLDRIAGFDDKDATTVKRTDDEFIAGIENGIKGMRIGVPKEFFVEGMEEGVAEKIKAAIKQLEELGAQVEEVSLPSLKSALATYYIIMPVEVASNLSRYDGIKYGLSLKEEAEKLLDVYTKTREAGFGQEAKRRIVLGTYTSSAGYYDAYYKKALEVQQVIRNDFKRIFERVDLLAGATSPTVAFPLGERVDDPISMYLADVLTVPVNIAGLPGISVPAGFSEGLPVGLQLIAPWWQENKLLRTAYTFERANEYVNAKPELDD